MPRRFCQHTFRQGLAVVGVRRRLPHRTRSAMLCAVAAVGGLNAEFADAGVWRDDVTQASFTALANQTAYASVGAVNSYQPISGPNDYFGSGVLIAGQWILTAAHLLRYNNGAGTIYNPTSVTYVLNGTTYNAEEFFTHPDYQDNTTGGFDLGLIHLSTPITGVTPAQLYTGSSELNATGTIVGYGWGGIGSDGAANTFDYGAQASQYQYNVKRAGQNVINQTSYFGNSNYLGVNFDNPSGGNALPLEYLPAEGDSGGGLFINNAGVQQLAGIVAFGSPDATAKYGNQAFFTRVSQLTAWIDDQISAQYWSNAAGGSFSTAGNWEANTVPGSANIAVFDLAGTYGVSLSSAISNERIRVRSGDVTLNLGGHTYTLGSSTLEDSLSVARADTDVCSLTISSGTMSAVDVGIGEASTTTGQLTVASGGTLAASSAIAVGGTPGTLGGTGTLQVNTGGDVLVNSGMKIYATGTLTNAGSVSWAGGSISLSPGALIANQIGGVFDIQNNLSMTGSSASMSNAGLLRKSAGTSTATLIVPLTNTGTIQVQSGTLALASSGSSSGGTLLTAASTRLNINSASAFNFSGANDITGGGVTDFGSLVANSGTLKIDSGAYLIATGTLNNSGAVDLNSRLVLDYTTTSPLSAIKSEIATGYASGAWNGGGIDSSSAAAVAANHSNNHKTAIGYGEASTLNLTSFGGQTVDSTSILMRYTLAGDANLDGTVNVVDFNMLAAGYNKTGQLWTGGDFNYDGKVNAEDFDAIATNYGQVFSGDLPLDEAPLGVLVPEPALAAALLPLLALRRRRVRR